MSIDKVKEKILLKAEKEAEEILSRAKAEIEKEKNIFLEEKRKEFDERFEKAVRKIENELKRKIDQEKLLADRKILEVKRKFIDDVFERVMEKLTSMKKDDYLKFLENLIVKDAPVGESEIILNEKDKKLFSKSLIERINKKIGKERKVKLSNKIAEIKGGCIIRGNEVEIDDSFETLVNDERERSEIETAKQLFGDEK